MKKILLITLFLLITNCIFSQASIYPDSVGTKVFYENGYTYQANRSSGGDIYVYNQNNTWIGITPVNKITGEPPLEYGPNLLDVDVWRIQVNVLFSILEESYSTEEKKKIKEAGTGRECFINLFINPITGKVDDVRFSFYRLSYYMYIPVSKFREIELKIKERLQFEVTDYGKQFNYIYYWNDYNFE